MTTYVAFEDRGGGPQLVDEVDPRDRWPAPFLRILAFTTSIIGVLGVVNVVGVLGALGVLVVTAVVGVRIGQARQDGDKKAAGTAATSAATTCAASAASAATASVSPSDLLLGLLRFLFRRIGTHLGQFRVPRFNGLGHGRHVISDGIKPVNGRYKHINIFLQALSETAHKP